jgi:hypothetical protein
MQNVPGPYYLKESLKGEWWACGYNGKIVRRFPADQFAAADEYVTRLVHEWRGA